MDFKLQIALVPCLLLTLLSSALPAAETSPVAFSAHHLRWAVNIEMMRGHVTTSLEALRQGKIEMVRAHAGHPLEEHYDLLARGLRARNPDFEAQVRSTLDGLGQLLQSQFSTDVYEREVTKLSALLDQGLQMLVPPDVLALPKFQSALIARLSLTASQEYAVAVRDGRLVTLSEYQDAFAFVVRAHILAQKYKGQLPPAALQQLQQLRQAIPSVPPATLASPEEVSQTARRIASVIEQAGGTSPSRRRYFGLLMSPLIVIRSGIIQVDPAKEIAAIRDLLDEIKRAYRRGEVRRVRELTAVLYLEHFEKFEGDLFDKAPELNAKVEPILGLRLRQLMKTKAPPSEVDSLIDDVLPALKKVEKVLTGK